MKTKSDSLEITRYDISESFDHININLKIARLTVVATESDHAYLECREIKRYTHQAEVNDNALTVKSVDKRGLFGRVFFRAPEVTLYLPKKEYKTVSVHLITGKLSLKDVKAESLDIRNTTTKVWLTDTALNECATVAVVTGKVFVTNMKCRRLAVRTGCGSVALDGVFADDRIDVKTTTGSISLNNSDSPKCSFKATTGRIKGKLNSFD